MNTIWLSLLLAEKLSNTGSFGVVMEEKSLHEVGDGDNAPKDVIHRSNFLHSALQVDDGNRVRLLDQSFRDIFVTGSGQPVWCRSEELSR